MQLLNVWLHSNRTNPEDDDIGCEEDMKWIERCTKYISQIIQREYFAGIPLKRIIVGTLNEWSNLPWTYLRQFLPQVAINPVERWRCIMDFAFCHKSAEFSPFRRIFTTSRTFTRYLFLFAKFPTINPHEVCFFSIWMRTDRRNYRHFFTIAVTEACIRL